MALNINFTINDTDEKILLNDYNSEFSYNENKSNIRISFERIAFIFFVFFIIAVIFSSKVILYAFSSSSIDLSLIKFLS